MIRRKYEICCDECGKLIAVLQEMPAKIADWNARGILKRGNYFFCCKECAAHFRLHHHKKIK